MSWTLSRQKNADYSFENFPLEKFFRRKIKIQHKPAMRESHREVTRNHFMEQYRETTKISCLGGEKWNTWAILCNESRKCGSNWRVLQQDGRLPPIYFVPSNFGTDAISKDENVFSLKKKHFFFIIFSNFSNVQRFLFFFCQEKCHIEGWKDILKKITIWYALHSKFTTFRDF